MRRIVPAILLIAVLAIAGGLIANTAYEAGVSAAVTTASGAPGTVVSPVVAPYGYGYGFGWHPYGFGFGLFGFFGTLLFLFIVFALLRAIFFGGRHRGGWGSGGWGPGGPAGPGGPGGAGGHGYSRWENRAHETFDEWHGQAHGTQVGTPPTAGGSAPTPPTDPA